MNVGNKQCSKPKMINIYIYMYIIYVYIYILCVYHNICMYIYNIYIYIISTCLSILLAGYTKNETAVMDTQIIPNPLGSIILINRQGF